LQITCKLLANYLQITCKLLAKLIQPSFAYSVAGLLLSLSVASAQDYALSPNGTPFLVHQFDRSYTIAEAQTLFAKLLPLTAGTTFVQVSQQTDKYGISHAAYQQYYKGVKVKGGEYWVHSKDGQVTHLTGDYRILQVATAQPSQTAAQVLAATLHQIGASKYSWEDPAAEQALRYLRADSAATYMPKGELVWVRDDRATKGNVEQHRLAYYYEITATEPDLHLAVYADAHTGLILKQHSTVCSVTGTAETQYSGTQSINTRKNAQGRFELIDGSDTNVNEINVRTAVNNAYITDNDNNWTLAEHGIENQEAFDAHWGAMQTQAYWRTVHQRNGYDNTGSTLNMHVRVAGGVDNAWWNQNTRTAIFWRGATLFKSLVPLDVVAHEIGHGVNYSWGLEYTGDAAAMHEGISDIWAACITARNGSGNPWLLGEQCMITTPTLSYMRNMQNPKSEKAYNKCASTVGGTFWEPNSPHAQGGLIGHWFYLLCQGGSGKNDVGNSFSVAGIGMEKAEKLVYQMTAGAGYLPSNAIFPYFSPSATQAARDIFGECSPEMVSVVNALYAVHLRSQPYKEPTLKFVTQPNYICSGQTSTVEANYTEPNTFYEWTITGGDGLVFIGNRDGIDLKSIQIAYLPNQFSPIQPRGYRGVNLTTYCRTGKDAQGNWLRENIKTIRYDIWVGQPDDIGNLDISYPYLCTIYGNQIGIQPVAGATTYRWFSASPELSISHQNDILATLTINYRKGGNRIREVGFVVVAGNECSNLPNNIMELEAKPTTYTWRYFTMEVLDNMTCFRTIGGNPDEPSPSQTFTGYPNPASSSYTIALDGQQKIAFSYKVFNSVGSLLAEGSSENGENKVLQVSSWADGIYTVLVQTDNGVQALKLAVQKGNVAN
jgi:bacillolysin